MKTFEFKPTENSLATVYLHSLITTMETYRTSYPVVIVFPGGGYEHCSLREAEPVAFEYFAAGFNVVVLNQYSVQENASNFNPLLDAAKTIITVRKHARQWHCNPHQIAVCGFSAGGHLAASLGTMWNLPKFYQSLDIDKKEIRPDAMILCYPVICADEYAHQGSLQRVSGSCPGTKEYKFWDITSHVDAETCPAFLWHTVNDQSVPVENTIAMISALQNHAVPYECHLFPEGTHGMSVCTQEVGSFDPYNQRWMPMSIQWLYRLFDYTK